MADGECNGSPARKIGTVAKQLARPLERQGHGRAVRVNGGLERPEMKRPHSVLWRECSFRKNQDRFPVPERVLDLLELLQAGARVAAVKGEVAELAKECADEGHIANLVFCDEMIVHAKGSHEHEHIGVAGVVANEHTGTLGAMLAFDLHATADQREIRQLTW